MSKTSTSGFTIVEILITIVVIGILASISIVAFNGVQGRAIDARRVSAIDAVEKAMHVYKAQNGTFPIDYVENMDFETSTPFTCIGESSDYPARDGFEAGECAYMIEDGSRFTYAQVIPELNETIKSIIGTGSMPNGSYPPFGSETGGFGLFMRGVWLNSAVNYGDMIQMAYYDKGTNGGNSCGRGIREEMDIGDGQTVVMCLLETE